MALGLTGVTRSGIGAGEQVAGNNQHDRDGGGPVGAHKIRFATEPALPTPLLPSSFVSPKCF